jgi:hypothetical protein
LSRSIPALHHPGASFAQQFFAVLFSVAQPLLAVRSFLFVLTSSPLYFSPAHTFSMRLQRSLLSANLLPLKIPGGIGAHGLSGFEPEGQSAFLSKKKP